MPQVFQVGNQNLWHLWLGAFVSWPTLTDEGGLRGGWVVMDRIEEILKLAREGFRVFPLKPGTKIPAIEKWPELATTDEVQIRQWAGSFPGSNWGLACGKDSGVFVVDIDAKRGGL